MPVSKVSESPVETIHSSNINVHRLVRLTPSVMVLEPGRGPWIAAFISLCVLPLGLWYFCQDLEDASLRWWIPRLPLPLGAGLTVSALGSHFWGTRIRFDLIAQTLTLSRFSGFQTFRRVSTSIPLSKVCGVQFCEGGLHDGGKIAYQSFQLNLVLGPHPIKRVNLLENGNKLRLKGFGVQIAKFLEIPFFLGSSAQGCSAHDPIDGRR